jgi:hypothetical protein
MTEGPKPNDTARSLVLLVSSLFALVILAMALTVVPFALSATQTSTTSTTTTSSGGNIYVQGVVKVEIANNKFAFNFSGYNLLFTAIKECTTKGGACTFHTEDTMVPLNSTGGYQAKLATGYLYVYEITMPNCTTIGSNGAGGSRINHEACSEVFPYGRNLYGGQTYTLNFTLNFFLDFTGYRIPTAHCFSHLGPRLIPL